MYHEGAFHQQQHEYVDSAIPAVKPRKLVTRPSVPTPTADTYTHLTRHQRGKLQLSSVSNAERRKVDAFLRDYPNFAKLPHDEIVQLMATYRSKSAHREEQIMRDEGVLDGCLADFSIDEDGAGDSIRTSDDY